MRTTLGRRPARVARLDGRGAPRSRFLGTNVAASRQMRTTRVRSPAANLLDYGKVFGSIDTERFHAHAIAIAEAFPNICEPSGSEWDVTAL